MKSDFEIELDTYIPLAPLTSLFDKILVNPSLTLRQMTVESALNFTHSLILNVTAVAQTPILALQTFTILAMLADSGVYPFANDLLKTLQLPAANKPLPLHQLLSVIPLIITQYETPEAKHVCLSCFRFLLSFLKGDADRQLFAARVPNLLTSLVSLMKEPHYSVLPHEVKWTLICFFFNDF